MKSNRCPSPPLLETLFSPLLFSSPLLSSPFATPSSFLYPLSFLGLDFLPLLSAPFFSPFLYFSLLFASSLSQSSELLHIRFNPRLYPAFFYVFFSSLSGFFSTSSLLLLFFLFFSFFFLALYLSLSRALGFGFSRKSKPEENTATERERERERESRKRARKPFTRGRSERSVHRTSQHSVSLSQFLDRPAVLNAIFKNAGRPGRVIALWQRRPEACAILYGFAFEGRECWTCQRFLWSSAKDTYAGCSGFLSLCFTLSLPVFFYLPPCSLRSFFLSSFNSRFLHCRTRLEDRLDDYSSVFTPPSIAISRYLFAFTPLFQWHLPKGNVRGSN